jgi:hypothetical protein
LAGTALAGSVHSAELPKGAAHNIVLVHGAFVDQTSWQPVADILTKKGYNEPNVVTNDTTNQQRPTTLVYYEGKAHTAALDVAKILGVPTSQVKPMDANARALADRAQVAVFVGGDKAQ